MAGAVIFPSEGRDEFVRMLQEKLLYFRFGEGGFQLSPETEVDFLTGSATDTFSYVISSGQHSIVSISQISDTFWIDGDHTATFAAGDIIVVEGSTGNDGLYNLDNVVYSAPNTFLYVVEEIPSGVIDGELSLDGLPIAKGPGDDDKHYPLVIEALNFSGTVVEQTLTDTTGAGVLTGDGSGTVNYKTGQVNIVWDTPVLSSRLIRTRFKYHAAKKDVSGGAGYLDLESAYHYNVIFEQSTGDYFRIAGDVVGEFAGVPKIEISGSTYNDGIYTVSSVSLSSGNTFVYVTESIETTVASPATTKMRHLSADGKPELFFYDKEFGGGVPPDTQAIITFRGEGYGTIRCELRLRESEGTDDGHGAYGGSPFYYEAGVFTEDDVMVAYMTFDKTKHTGANIIEHTCDFVV
jgi:hypothetical protein